MCAQVKYIEADVRVKMIGLVEQQAAPPGLERLSHVSAKQAQGYTFDASAGEGITAFIVDTGVRISHEVSLLVYARVYVYGAKPNRNTEAAPLSEETSLIMSMMTRMGTDLTWPALLEVLLSALPRKLISLQ